MATLIVFNNWRSTKHCAVILLQVPFVCRLLISYLSVERKRTEKNGVFLLLFTITVSHFFPIFCVEIQKKKSLYSLVFYIDLYNLRWDCLDKYCINRLFGVCW